MYVGDVTTRADLDRFTGLTPGSVFRVIDEDVWLMWAPDQDQADDDTTPGTGVAIPEPSWVVIDQARAVQPYGLVDGWWPFVEGPDMVAAYPEVSRDLANKLGSFGADWQAYRDGRPWPVWEGTSVHFPGAGGFMAAGFWHQPGGVYWSRNGWHELYTVAWATYSSPNGPEINAWNNGTRWRLSHSDNLFYGTFIAKPMAARDARAAALMVPADIPDDIDQATTEPGWDVAATVAQLAALVIDLQDEIAQLKGAAR